MAEFMEVMKQRTRMCEAHSEKLMCNDCPLSFRNSSSNLGCHEFTTEYPRKAEEIIMKWAEEHPVQTNADKFKDVFKEVFGIKLGDGLHSCELIKCSREADCETCKYKGFWQKEYEEPKGEE